MSIVTTCVSVCCQPPASICADRSETVPDTLRGDDSSRAWTVPVITGVCVLQSIGILMLTCANHPVTPARGNDHRHGWPRVVGNAIPDLRGIAELANRRTQVGYAVPVLGPPVLALTWQVEARPPRQALR